MPLESAMPCKSHNATEHGENRCVISSNTQKTGYAWIAEAHESGRKRAEEIQQKDHEEHVAEEGFISLSHYNLVHKP